jgi:hypothetical protein
MVGYMTCNWCGREAKYNALPTGWVVPDLKVDHTGEPPWATIYGGLPRACPDCARRACEEFKQKQRVEADIDKLLRWRMAGLANWFEVKAPK